MAPTTEWDKQALLKNCTAVKTVLMLLVVAYHSLLFWGGNWFTAKPSEISKPMYMAAQWLNSFHIYAFALVSDYVFYYSKCECQKYQNFGPFLANKLKRLLVPYAFVAAVWAIPIHCLFLSYDIRTLFTKFVLGTSPGQLWFLLMLFWVYIFFWFLSDFFASYPILGGVVALICYGVGVFGSMAAPDAFMIWTACRYVPFFWLGFKLRQTEGQIVFRMPWWLWIALDLLLFVAMQIVGSFDTTFFKMLHMGLCFLLNVTGAIMAFVVIQKLAGHIRTEGKLFCLLSSRSMGIYLFHQQVIYFVIVGLDGYLWPSMTALACFLISITVSVWITGVLMKFRVTRCLIGEK